MEPFLSLPLERLSLHRCTWEPPQPPSLSPQGLAGAQTVLSESRTFSPCLQSLLEHGNLWQGEGKAGLRVHVTEFLLIPADGLHWPRAWEQPGKLNTCSCHGPGPTPAGRATPSPHSL